jgi:hypothetical protein
VPTPRDQIGWCWAPASAWPQLSHLSAVAGDNEDFAAGDAVKDFSPVVA